MLETIASVRIGTLNIEKPLLLWINDGLMAIFFLLVGLELKREVLYGDLSNVRKCALPLCAAIGGIIVPSGIYAFINWGDSVAMNGWAIPAATDIAFALGVLAVIGKRVPASLKILLASIAVIDDLAAIVIIAVFYTEQLSLVSLGLAGVGLALLFILNRLKVTSLGPYIIVGMFLWVTVLKSGVHATLAGVALAIFIPARKDAHDSNNLAHQLEHALHPWVAFAILPLFAFANSGIPLAGLALSSLLQPVPLGIALGLFIGKQVGIFSACYLAVKTRLAQLPENANWRHIHGISALCGIGFTMSLFIGSLAFEGGGGPDYAIDDRLGILTGSLLSAIVGATVLLRTSKRDRVAREAPANTESPKVRETALAD